MNRHRFTLSTLVLLLALPSCTGPKVRVVEANPDTMYEIGGKPRGQVVIRERDADGNATTRTSNSGNISTSRFRLPNMEGLPDDKELRSVPDESSGGVIARPPSE